MIVRNRIISARIINPTNINNAIKSVSKISVSFSFAFLSSIIKSNKSINAAIISNKSIKSSILRVIYKEVSPIPVDSLNFLFSASELINNTLTKYHGFNSRVDVSVFNELGEEVEVEVDASNLNYVTVNLGRLTVTNNWTIKIEK